MNTKQDYLQSLPVQELINLRTEINRQAYNEYSWSHTKEEFEKCKKKVKAIDDEIERRKDLIL